MDCKSCGKEIPLKSKFCRYCGVSVDSDSGDVKTSGLSEEKVDETDDAPKSASQHRNEDTSVKGIVVSLFNISEKKSFVESLILIIFIAVAILPLYLYLPETPEETTYVFNFGVTAAVVFAVFYFKGFKWFSLVWAVVAGLITLIFAYLAGLVMLFYAFMSVNRGKITQFNDLEKEYLYSLLKSGLIWYGLGSVATYGGYLYAVINEGESFYLWYGAVLVGLWRIGKALYYYAHPKQLASLVENLVSSNELTNEDGEAIKKKTRTDFKKFMLYGFLIFIGIIIVIAMFSF